MKGGHIIRIDRQTNDVHQHLHKHGRSDLVTELKSNRQFVVRKNGTGATIWLYSPIGVDRTGEGVAAIDFIRQLEDLGPVTNIDLRINCEGGSIDQAWAMYAALVRHPATITTHIDGLAASCAAWLAMAGDQINISEAGMMMVHLPLSGCFGNEDELMREVEVLRTMKASIAQIFSSRTGKPVSSWVAAMTKETWFSSAEAKAAGLVTSIIPNKIRANVATSKTPLQIKNENMRRRLHIMELSNV